MPEILDITTHMGGGVGKALSGIAAYNNKNATGYRHRIIMLEKPEKLQFVDHCRQNGIEIVCEPDENAIFDAIDRADLVLLSWWHHPKMAGFLNRLSHKALRLIVWSHVNGCNYPVLPFELLQASHKLFLTTGFTLQNPNWSEENRRYAKDNTAVIYGLGEINQSVCPKKQHDDFRIGYVGTLSYNKLHPDFMRYCAAVDVPGAQFLLAGDTEQQDQLEKDARAFGIADRCQFCGYITRVGDFLSGVDVFGYLLNPEHFGTTENALLEAMAAGLPVVVLNQCAEKYIVKHMQTGMLANSPAEYAQCIRYLYENPAERVRLGENARQCIQNEFSMSKNVRRMNAAFDQVLCMDKKAFDFCSVFGNTPTDWFLSCLGQDKNLFADSINPEIMKDQEKADEIERAIQNCRPILRDQSKSSIRHFKKYYPNDPNLQYWASLLSSGIK